MVAERDLQEYIARKLENLGWNVVIYGKGVKGERDSLTKIILENRFFNAIEKINKISLTDEEKKSLRSKLLFLPNTIEGIKEFMDYIKNGIPFKLRRDNEETPKQIFLFDFENIDNNDFLAVREFEVEEDGERRRFDFCLFINGIPLVAIETKNPFKEEEKETTWYDALRQLLEYENSIPSIFKFIQFCIATDGYVTKYFPNYFVKGSVEEKLKAYSYLEKKDKGTWKTIYPFKENEVEISKLFENLDITIYGMLSKSNLLDLIENFIFIKSYEDTFIKIIARWMQFRATNKIVKRVLRGKHKVGLIWHWQGSGKTLTMAFSAWKLFRHPKLDIPTIFIVVDRRDLERQIYEEFTSIGIGIEKIRSIKELVTILKWGGKEREGKRGIFICLIQKFQFDKLKKYHESGEINLNRENIVILTDESHRSQYGVLANVMRGIFKNAFIFGFTGTPLTKPERNTFEKFSPPGELYLDRYGMSQSINDGYTLPIRYQARLPELHLKEDVIEELSEFEEEVVEELTEGERRLWRKKIRPKLAILKNEERIEKVCEDIVRYFKEKIEKTPFKAMVATVDRESCVIFKKKLDELLGDPKLTEIVMTYQAREKSKLIEEYKKELKERFGHSDFTEINKKLIRSFKREEYPRIVVVSDMLLTGFDSPKLWVLFLHKPLREHRLLQAISRTNRPFNDIKEFGVVIDYIGVAKNLKKALEQFESEFIKEALLLIRDIKISEKEFEEYVKKLSEMLRDIEVYDLENVDKAVEKIILEDKEVEFQNYAKKLKILYELLSPSEVIFKHLAFYKFVIAVSVALARYRRMGMRLGEIERCAKKTFELIKSTIGVERIEKIGEVEISKEMIQLEKERKPIAAMRILAEISRRISTLRADFYVSLRKEIEKIYEQMKKEKKVTKEILEKIKEIGKKLEERKIEEKKYEEIFPVYDVLRNYFQNRNIVKISKEIMKELKEKDLLSKEYFIKKSGRKKIRGVIRSRLLKNFGRTKDLTEIVNKIFINLEDKYG